MISIRGLGLGQIKTLKSVLQRSGRREINLSGII